jgi:hypothetical protein
MARGSLTDACGPARFRRSPARTSSASASAATPTSAAPVPPEKWPDFWKHHRWNELRARIVGNPPKITTWIKGVKFLVWTDTRKRAPDKGGIALQVHGGGDFTKQFVRYRNIRVKRLDKE